MRGLKRNTNLICNLDEIVAPYVGAWIETTDNKTIFGLPLSHPTWVRGLKLVCLCQLCERLLKSHPTWVRGLKHISIKAIRPMSVAPYVGAWIETPLDVEENEQLFPSHPTWVRG